MRLVLKCLFAAAAVAMCVPAPAQQGVGNGGQAPQGAPAGAGADALDAGSEAAVAAADRIRALETALAEAKALADSRPAQSNAAAKAEFDALKPHLDALENELKDSRKEISRLTRENKALLQRAADADKELKAAREKTVNSVTEELRMKLERAEKRVADLEQQIKTGEEIRADGEKMRRRMAELANQVKANANRQAMEEELAAIRQKNEVIEKSLKDSYADSQQCKKDLAALKKANDELSATLAAERGRARAADEKASAALKAAQEAAASLEAKVKSLENELKDARWSASQFLEQLKIANRERAAMEARLAREGVLKDLSPASSSGPRR